MDGTINSYKPELKLKFIPVGLDPVCSRTSSFFVLSAPVGGSVGSEARWATLMRSGCSAEYDGRNEGQSVSNAGVAYLSTAWPTFTDWAMK